MKLNLSFQLVLVFIFEIFFFTSCDSRRVMDENREIPDATWKISNIAKFNFEVPDTSQLYRLLVNVRNTNQYAYSNLYLFVAVTDPDDRQFRDTLQIKLADNTGSWTGTGAGNLWHNRIPFMEKVKLTSRGPYSVEIGHGMREDDLTGISDIGFRVEQHEK